MENARIMALVLVILVGATAFLSWMSSQTQGDASTGATFTWIGFLYVLPLILAGCVLTAQRWAFMAGVMYGTLGLALDVSTMVQELTAGQGQLLVLVMSTMTGLLNFLLILLGGRGLLTDHTSSARVPRQ